MTLEATSEDSELEQELDQALHAGLQLLGHDAFRPGQRDSIVTLLREHRMLLVAPTGGGKSLVYQLPGLLLPGVTLVISPLIALMHDQVTALQELDLPATFIASTLDGDEVRARMASIARGEAKLVYVAPERMFFDGFRGLIRDVGVSMIAIDEAHCISEWGHDFRPEYARLGEVVREHPEARVIACTATATPFVRDEIVARLGLPDDTPQVIRGFARPNLALRARERSSKRDAEAQVDAQLREALGDPGEALGTAIVYSPTRKKTDAEAARLAGRGWAVAAYHAGLDSSTRSEVSDAFSSGQLEVVVATNAFGMGIDRSDVRAVIHLAPPGSIEAYYQEVGRAGRDGEPAWGLLLFNGQDLALRRSLLQRDGEGAAADPEIIEHKWGLFLELMRWAEGGSCRHDAILRYFGDDAEVLDGCGRCDMCERLDGEEEDDPETVTLIVRKALSGVARTHGRFGLMATVALLCGNADDRLSRSRLDETRTFGVLSGEDPKWVQRLLRRLISAGWVIFSGDRHPVVMLTADGRAVMMGEREARLLLPERRAPKTTASRRRGGSRSAAPDEALSEADMALFEALRAHRRDLARELVVPPYVVASDRTLRDIARLRPHDEHTLSLAHGVGPAKLERYGAGLLAVIRQHG
jgi:ATP-dependent DNA helicase RecQ